MGDAMDKPDEEYVKETDEPEGAIGPEDLVQPETTYEVPDARPKVEHEVSDVSDIAVEVMAGKWGTGQDRRKRLSDAGYNVKEVEDEVVRRLNP
jgi:CW_7 repeat